MKLKHLLITSLLAMALSAPVMADTRELGTPVIELMPVFKEVRSELKLSEEQSKTVDAWLAEAPAKRKKLMQETVAVRAELREALLNRDSRLKREELKFKLAEANRRLIELSSLCARMLHNTLTEEQYTKVVAKYKQSIKS